MEESKEIVFTKAQESRAAIERLYIEMRHIFNIGILKPYTSSGNQLKEALLTIKPEIYGAISDISKIELNGLAYVIERLPKGIEECRSIRLVSEEGLHKSGIDPIVPYARKRNCYKIGKNQMFIEITRGRSEIYDILTHLTFFYNEAWKIKNQSELHPIEWAYLENIVQQQETTPQDLELAFIYTSTLLGRTYEETKNIFYRLQNSKSSNNGLFYIVYWLGKNAKELEPGTNDIEITFSPALRQRIGHHIYGEKFAHKIKKHLETEHLFDRPLHIISANMHSFLNTLYIYDALKERDEVIQYSDIENLILNLSKEKHLSAQIEKFASENGMTFISDTNGTNISAQIIDMSKVPIHNIIPEIKIDTERIYKEKPVLIVIDYAFGEQAYEIMDELLKIWKQPHKSNVHINVKTISIMGKAGILQGNKGDIMIPTAHVFEGSGDNYPFKNELTLTDFQNDAVSVYEGNMITVLGTSLQNKDILEYFHSSSWKAIGLEMEGAHYQKAIQSQSTIRHNIRADIKLLYAYYASDNPLLTGNTLASGSLGIIGIKPTYLITIKILNKIFNLL
ncbi:MAG: hypothetical protein QM536_03420 [Chitinophagaceae bacterium]|nr:hypothetical protein [Chitinophagaceae bacterium]